MPVRMGDTVGTVADCTQADALIERFDMEYLLADRQKMPQGYDEVLYQARHQVENCFGTLKD